MSRGLSVTRCSASTGSTATPVRPRCSWTQAEWSQAVARRNESQSLEKRDEGYVTFRRRLMARYRAMSEAGLGHWYGAFLGQALVADLGILERR